ncbi:MAG: class I SAM-dependent methyltransferase [Candidatus Bathyarchaeia archaeon]
MLKASTYFYGKWFFESKYKYFKKRLPIKRLYLNFINWASKKTGLNLIDGYGKTALDIGCAYDFIVELLKKLKYNAYGIDISKLAVTKGKDMILSDAKYMPFKQSSFDLTTCFETIEHLYNPELMINEAYRILKPNGVFIISTPIPGLFSFIIHVLSLTPYSFHPSIKPIHQWIKILKKFKLKVVAFKPYLLLPIPATLFKKYFILEASKFLSSHVKIVCIKLG